MRLTKEQIEAGRSGRGGWTKRQLAQWGVPWPPPRGWRQALLKGEPVPGVDEFGNFEGEAVVLVLNYPGHEPPAQILFNGMIYTPSSRQLLGAT